MHIGRFGRNGAQVGAYRKRPPAVLTEAAAEAKKTTKATKAETARLTLGRRCP